MATVTSQIILGVIVILFKNVVYDLLNRKEFIVSTEN